jgi:ubiquinone/menaquinone biosynthesis C-methylase UbiE
MPRTAAFDTNADRYDQWFTRHVAAYLTELSALRRLVPSHGSGIEIGAGTGRFATALGVRVGLDPSLEMLQRARGRGLAVLRGVAEVLPFSDEAFDYCLIVTTICFVDNAQKMVREVRRVLKPYGSVILGFIDRESPLGQDYLDRQSENVFYREATFYSAQDVETLLVAEGFGELSWVQTLFSKDPVQAKTIERLRSGYGEGSFVAVKAIAPP